MSHTRPIEILLIEDNPGDVDLTCEALEEASIPNRVFVVEDGMEALAFLKKEHEYRDMPTPSVILLDLNLPKKTGHEVLDFIKNNENLKHIPVIILTSSAANEDVLKSYKLHANSFVTKPSDFRSFVEIMKTVEDFWLGIAQFPILEEGESIP